MHEHRGWDELKLRYVLPQQICNNILPLFSPHSNNGDDGVVRILTNDGGYGLLHKALNCITKFSQSFGA
jgi:hypothetical protein